MGRRSRAREREREQVAASAAAAADPAPERRRSWRRALNPFKFRRLTRSRARAGAIGFGVLAVVFVVLGRALDDVAWYSSAVLLAILAVVWGLTSTLLGKDDPSG
jgi:Flp pilus assembly protein TadB